jgi:hypothetical protein
MVSTQNPAVTLEPRVGQMRCHVTNFRLFSQWGTDYRNSLTAIYHHRIRVFLLFSHTLVPYFITHQFAPSSTLRQLQSPLASFQQPLNDFLTQPNSQTMKLSSNQRAPAPRKKSRIRDP